MHNRLIVYEKEGGDISEAEGDSASSPRLKAIGCFYLTISINEQLKLKSQNTIYPKWIHQKTLNKLILTLLEIYKEKSKPFSYST